MRDEHDEHNERDDYPMIIGKNIKYRDIDDANCLYTPLQNLCEGLSNAWITWVSFACNRSINMRLKDWQYSMENDHSTFCNSHTEKMEYAIH